MIKNALMLSDRGWDNLKTAMVTCAVSNLSLFLPFFIIMQALAAFFESAMSAAPPPEGRLWMLWGMGLAAAALFYCAYRREYDKTYMSAYTEGMATRVEVAERMRRLPMSFFNRKDLSELTTNIMGDCTIIEMVMSHVVPQIIGYGISSAVACLLLAFYDWRMALAVFCTLPLSVALVLIGRRFDRIFAERQVAAKLRVSDQVQEYLDGIQVVKGFGLAGAKFESLRNALHAMMQASIRFELLAGTVVSLASALLQAGIGITVLVGTGRMASGELGAIPFLLFVMISVRIYAPLLAILTLLPMFFYMLTSGERMRNLRREPFMEGDETVEVENYDIEMRDVRFSYGKEEVIRGLSLTIPQGKVTALVGPSGSGKSTLSRLAARFWDVDSGEIRIGGVDVRRIAPERLMSWMSFVFQEVVLFNDTVANNIRIGRRGASMEDVLDAARRAGCDEFIKRMPQGYDTLIGENGCTISGGERQRVSIARALLKNAPVVLLDEATAFLDPESEEYVQSALSELIKGRTVLVIAHRLRTVLHADTIVVLDNGIIAEQGTGKELLDRNGLFARLYALQREGAAFTGR